ncbi:MAG: hypothetical protein IH624_00715 [Phycisphaerae bacterium]|nr:hypothetical protein [Phycisphaerae bacterium]
MGRLERIALGGYVYHVLNRANGRLRIFKKGGDWRWSWFFTGRFDPVDLLTL